MLLKTGVMALTLGWALVAAAQPIPPVQSLPPPDAARRTPTPPLAEPSPLARQARRALTAGRSEEALALADRAIAARPSDLDAVTVKIEVLADLGEPAKALEAYERWYAVVRVEQPPLVARLARAELTALSRESSTQIDALYGLAAAGQATALAALTELAWASPPTSQSWPAIVALGGLGDPKAAARIVQAVKESTGSGKVVALQAAVRAKAPGTESLLREALATRDPMLQSAGADGAAALGLKGLVPDLQRVAAAGDQFGRFAAAVALARLGATGGESLIEAARESPALDARLLAADARKARGDTTWPSVVRPLLESPEGTIRFQAAERLLTIDRPEAMKVFLTGTVDPNPAVRVAVATILSADPSIEPAQLRRLLKDGIPRVRLLAATALAK